MKLFFSLVLLVMLVGCKVDSGVVYNAICACRANGGLDFMFMEWPGSDVAYCKNGARFSLDDFKCKSEILPIGHDMITCEEYCEEKKAIDNRS